MRAPLRWCSVVVSLLAAMPGCGPTSTHQSSTPHSAEIRTLDEDRALSIIREVLQEDGIARGPLLTVQLPGGRTLDVDVRLAQTRYGIEWVSPQDQADLGDALPTPNDGGRLQITRGQGDSADVQVLVLHHSLFEFANERVHVQHGVPGAGEAEARLRRDIRDYLHYVRGEGAL